jgi:hypothetical protein
MADQPIDQVAAAASSAAPAQPSAPAPAPSPTPNPDAAVAAAQADQPAAASTAAPAVSPDSTGAASTPEAKPAEGLGPTLLQQFDAEKAKPAEAAKPTDKPVEGAKPAEAAKPVDPAKPAEAAPPQPAELAKIDYFKDVAIPETIKIADEQRTELTGALDLIRSGKAAEGMKTLVSLHEKALTDYAKQVGEDQWAAFRKTNEDWKTQVMADPLLGGAGHKTAMAAIARMRDMSMSGHKPGTPEYEREAKEYNDFLQVTGAGNHPAYLRQMHNFARYFDEPPMPPSDIRPPKDIGRAPGDRRSRLYPNTNVNGRG